MTPRACWPLLLALALPACDSTPAPPSPASTVDGWPALLEITDAQGSVEGWLFGTIHSLPDDVEWRTSRFDGVANAADLLVVEVDNLADDAALADLFGTMAYDEPVGQTVAQRLDPALHDRYATLLESKDADASQYDAMESWAAALGIAQLAPQGDSKNGVDRVLLGEFASREVLELEGAREQLAVFDTLPEAEQRDLLAAVVREAALPQGERDNLAAIWKSGDFARLEEVTRQGMLADPQLREALLFKRNRDWAAKIENLLTFEAKPLVAVGAGHLLGPQGLPALLEARGYTIRRIQ